MILGMVGGALTTVNMVSFIVKWFAESLTLAVKFITDPVDTFIEMFWENVAVVPVKEKLKYLLIPVSLTIIWPKLKLAASVTLAVRFIMSVAKIFVKDLFMLVFITGNIVSKVKTLDMF